MRRVAVHTGVYGDGMIDVSCWCEARFVGIPKAWVGVRTRSCGRIECHAPQESKRVA